MDLALFHCIVRVKFWAAHTIVLPPRLAMRFWGCLHHTVCTSLKRINWNINDWLTVGSKRSKLIGLNACSFWESNLHDNTLISSSYLSNRATASSIVEGLHCENGSLAVASTNPNTAVAEESMFFWNEAIFFVWPKRVVTLHYNSLMCCDVHLSTHLEISLWDDWWFFYFFVTFFTFHSILFCFDSSIFLPPPSETHLLKFPTN